jgi:hypothetical protein
VTVYAAAAQPLAKSGEALKAGPIGLAVILLLCIACYFLFKSMSKHMRTVREQFPEEPAPPRRPGAPPLSRAEFTRSQAAKAEIIPPAARRPALDQSAAEDVKASDRPAGNAPGSEDGPEAPTAEK